MSSLRAEIRQNTGIARLAVSLVFGLACASGSTASDVAEITLAAPFRLGLGEQARLASEDLTVRFAAVAGDSRCPSDVTCFWAGDAKVEVRLTQGEDQTLVSLHTNGGRDYPRAAEALGCTLRLEDLEPYPSTKSKIAPEDYVATLVLTLEERSR